MPAVTAASLTVGHTVVDLALNGTLVPTRYYCEDTQERNIIPKVVSRYFLGVHGANPRRSSTYFVNPGHSIEISSRTHIVSRTICGPGNILSRLHVSVQ